MRITQHIIIALLLIVILAGVLVIHLGYPASGLTVIALSVIAIYATTQIK